jgi:glycosyltransferase involved in cell wall biosynthesis
MRVVVDGRALVPPDGIGVHTAEIAGRLGVTPTIASRQITSKQGIEHCQFRVAARQRILWQQLCCRAPPTQTSCGDRTARFDRAQDPSVVTLHDFTSLTMPGDAFLERLRRSTFHQRGLDRAKRVAAVSKSIASEAMRWFGVPPNLIRSCRTESTSFHPGGDRDDYILFVGTLEPRKGIEDLAAVWSSLLRPRLVLCGDPEWGVRVPEGVEVTGWMDRDLRRLYQRARCCLPSRYRVRHSAARGDGVRRAGDATRTGAIPGTRRAAVQNRAIAMVCAPPCCSSR